VILNRHPDWIWSHDPKAAISPNDDKTAKPRRRARMTLKIFLKNECFLHKFGLLITSSSSNESMLRSGEFNFLHTK
jgi:hypothetical protein